MRTILFLAALLICTDSFTQTFAIAHKSHSGAASDIPTSGIDRFGEIAPPLRRIERVENATDTCTLFYYGYRIGEDGYDTKVDHHPVFNAPDLDLDCIKQYYDSQVEWIGFDEDAKKEENKMEEDLLPIASLPTLPPLSLLLLGTISLAVLLSIRRSLLRAEPSV